MPNNEPSQLIKEKISQWWEAYVLFGVGVVLYLLYKASLVREWAMSASHLLMTVSYVQIVGLFVQDYTVNHINNLTKMKLFALTLAAVIGIIWAEYPGGGVPCLLAGLTLLEVWKESD